MYYAIKEIIDNTLGVSSVLEKPRDKSFGHFALPTFSFAKELRKAPQIIAQEFAQKIEILPQITNINVVNGYVNFSVSNAFLGQCAWKFLQDEIDFKKGESKKERILLEYVSANPTGPLHIGHARGAVFGDSLVRIGRFLGHTIHAEYYVNDAGVQIEKLGKSIYYAGRHFVFGENRELPEECYQGEYIFELAEDARRELGESVFESLESLERLSLFGKDKMLIEIRNNLAQIGIFFDSYVSEKELFLQWDFTLESLKAHNGIYDRDGKLWLKSTEYGDEKDRVIVRESGEPTYLAGDVIYHKNKFERNFSHYINIWGADHHGYIARVKAALEYLGFQSQRLEILLAQMVALLKDGIPYKMSKRAGNFILMKDVVDEVGADALRLMFLSKKPDTHLEFDVNLLKRQDASNPVYYINYAHARIHTLFSKSSFTVESFKVLSLEEFQMWDLQRDLCDLLVSALGIGKILGDAFSQRAPNKVVDYLYALAADFHRFYNETKILKTKQEEQILKVLVVVAHSIALGLNLLGIKAKVSM